MNTTRYPAAMVQLARNLRRAKRSYANIRCELSRQFGEERVPTYDTISTWCRRVTRKNEVKK